jgi:G:T-mismatch repair DNA endonuclease (very short patch repair protein)
VTRKLRRAGWTVIRVREHCIRTKQTLAATVARLSDALAQSN